MAARRHRRRISRRGERPLGISIAAVLEVVAAFYAFLGVAAFSALRFFGFRSAVMLISGFGGTILFIIGIILLFSAYGLWSGERWGWWTGIIVSIVLILSIALFDIPGFVLGLVLILYLTRDRVKKWFKV